jgi:hypothetical protein
MTDKKFVISAVSEKVKEWESQYGQMVTYSIKLEETNDEVIEINKKPDSPAPQVGQELFGHLEDSRNKEFPTRKFKVVNKAYVGGGKAPYVESPEKQASIYRSVALNNASLIFQGTGEAVSTILEHAESFDEWLTKNAPASSKEATSDKFAFKTETILDDDIDLDKDDKVDSSEIPFS